MYRRASAPVPFWVTALSDTASSKPRISAEGLALIKSLEGFRPHALKRGNGWVIGYGHTLSAREGTKVTETEAELLLQYDLLAVTDAIRTQVQTPLNPHQFDALASFVYSIGVEDFRASDVLKQINAGDLSAASDAMIGWPDTPGPEGPVRRRTAERALFKADPAATTSVAALLASPLPPVEEDGTVLPFPVADDAAQPEPDTVDAAPAAGEPAPEPFPTDTVIEPVARDTSPAPEPETVEVESDRPRSAPRDEDAPFPWRESAPLLAVGAIGFVSFGVAMGALRLASMPSARAGETALMGWILALVGLGCVGVAGWKLYERWGRSDPA